MGDSETGQVSEDAAKIYEENYLPSLFSEWCPLVIKAANIQRGQRVLDVACGTGALAITVSNHIGPDGTTVGIDINESMLSIARSKSSSVEWLIAPAEALPFEDGNFKCVVSQFGIMYFEDQEKAIREMMRVLQPGGSLAVVVWDKLENNAGLAAEDRLWQRVFGQEWGDEKPYSLGDKKILESLFKRSGVADFQITTHQGTALFDSIKSWIHTGAKGWSEDEALSDDQLEHLLNTAEQELTGFRTAQDTVAFPTSVHIVSTRKLRHE
ncbi:MAG: class I SAM-dependent methyltransferase [Gammaproteobacteria bacterium]|nr:class I SAM-dependent methyltransferase [Gammaproteobacteria bacterium]